MYAGEVADRDVREAQKHKRAQRRKAKKRRKTAGTALPSVALSTTGNESLSSRLAHRIGFRRTTSEVPDAPEEGTRTRSRASSVTSFARLTDVDSASAQPRRRRNAADTGEGIEMQDMSRQERQSESSSDLASSWKAFLWPRFMSRLMIKLQKAHDRATRTKALELPLTADPQGPFRVFVPDGEATSTPFEEARRESTRDYQEIGTSRAAQQPSRDLRGAGMPQTGWHWKGGIRKARLRAVDTF
jgi:hypothetical protein